MNRTVEEFSYKSTILIFIHSCFLGNNALYLQAASSTQKLARNKFLVPMYCKTLKITIFTVFALGSISPRKQFQLHRTDFIWKQEEMRLLFRQSLLKQNKHQLFGAMMMMMELELKVQRWKMHWYCYQLCYLHQLLILL